MQNLKNTVLTALQTYSAFSTLQGQKFYFKYPPNFTDLPVGSYFELDNFGTLFADNVEFGSEVDFQIDLWGKTSLSNYALALDTVMTSLDFVRLSSIDLYEDDTQIYHKAMRYKKDVAE